MDVSKHRSGKLPCASQTRMPFSHGKVDFRVNMWVKLSGKEAAKVDYDVTILAIF